MNVNKLRGKMAEAGYTQKKLSEAIGISERTLSNKMRVGVFGTDEAEKIIKVLNITNPAEIFFTN